MFSQIFVQGLGTSLREQCFQHHVFAVARSKMLAVFRNDPTNVLPCFLSIRPDLSRCLPSKPFFAITCSSLLQPNHYPTNNRDIKRCRGGPALFYLPPFCILTARYWLQ
jgi:hypothetical protein